MKKLLMSAAFVLVSFMSHNAYSDELTKNDCLPPEIWDPKSSYCDNYCPSDTFRKKFNIPAEYKLKTHGGTYWEYNDGCPQIQKDRNLGVMCTCNFEKS
ncbi:MAG: hypothetical protein H0X26_01460 [Alphaproteobacteria bacterium]|nr:hypothetical protein [Alphaproteobacteria bacterium]